MKNNKGNYYWTKDSMGNDMLIVEVNGRRWNFGSMVLDAVRRQVEYDPKVSLDEAMERERKHFSGWEMNDLKEEFEILKQTPEYKEIETKANRKG